MGFDDEESTKATARDEQLRAVEPSNGALIPSSSPGNDSDPSPATIGSDASNTSSAASPLPYQKRFEDYMAEGQTLLQEGRQALTGRLEVGLGESFLSKSAQAFESAAEIDPGSVAAFGQAGNALLALGELKLRTARLLQDQSVLSDLAGSSVEGSVVDWDDTRSEGGGIGAVDEEVRRLVERRDALIERLCGECEQALVEAGRRYRSALSLDNRDARAVFNWGLALCFRGQLLAEEGVQVRG